MKSVVNQRSLVKIGCRLAVTVAVAVMMIIGGTSAFAAPAKRVHKHKPVMHTYIIERTIPGAGNMTPQQLHDISAKSNAILKKMGPDIQWVDSYVTQDKIYCIYRATSPELIEEHAKAGGFPADHINEIDRMISPKTGR